MKKNLLTLVLAFCVLAGQGQTSTTASGVNTTELNSKWAQFTQLAEKKQYKQAIDEGVRVSILFTENRQYKYLQLIIPQYFISNKSGIWSLSLIVHSKG